MKIIYRLTFVSIALLGLTGCGFSTCPYYSDLDVIEQGIEENYLIGTYRLDTGSPASIGPGKLILKSNSELTLKNIPIGVFDVFNSNYSQDPTTLKDINGKWKLSINSNEPSISVELKFEEMDDDLNNIITNWKLFEKRSKPVILIILGDPDSCEAMKFIRKT